MRYKIVFSYDGTNFCGYQKQCELRTVESEFEKALFSINNQTLTNIVAAGRTDRGVHALGQTAHFDISVKITPYKLKCALNSLLPLDIHVLSAELVDDEFHARFMAKSKKYRYILNMGEYDPILRNYELQLNKRLDVDKMKKAANCYLGEHDFKSFTSASSKKESYIRKIFSATLKETDNKLIFEFTGNGFMKYQVRNMVGTLIKIGQGKLAENIIDEIFKDEMKSKHVMTSKSEGLYLVEVKY